MIFNSAEHSWLLPQNLQGSGPHPPIRIWNPICNVIFSSLISELQRKHFKTIILCPLKSQHQMNTNTQSLSSTVMARNFLTCVQADSSRSSAIDSKEPVLAFLSPTLKKCMRAWNYQDYYTGCQDSMVEWMHLALGSKGLNSVFQRKLLLPPSTTFKTFIVTVASPRSLNGMILSFYCLKWLTEL